MTIPTQQKPQNADQKQQTPSNVQNPDQKKPNDQAQKSNQAAGHQSAVKNR